MNAAENDVWVLGTRRNPEARVRLLCLPYAGAGASIYNTWARDFPAWVDVLPIQLPGRETRLREPLHREIPALLPALADAVVRWTTAPFAIFGHSFGALVAFELARELRRRGCPAPVHLFVSGRRAPHLPDQDPLHHLTEPQLIAKLQRMDGTPEAVLSEPELMAIFMPILRADLAANERYVHSAEPPLDCPLTAFGGLADERASRAEIDAWRVHTRGAFNIEMFPGGHFFLRSERAPLLRSIARAMDAALNRSAQIP